MALGTILRHVDPRKAVELGSAEADRIVAQTRRERALTARAGDIDVEISRLSRRSAYLRSKASRCRIGTNGRQKAISEAQACEGMIVLLRKAAAGDKLPPLQAGVFTAPNLERARGLLNSLRTA